MLLGPPVDVDVDVVEDKSTSREGRKKNDDGDDVKRRKRRNGQIGTDHTPSLTLIWTVSYYILLVGGAWAFWTCLWILTESDQALVDFLSG